MNKWFVTLKRRNTIKDMNNGAKGIFTIKTVIIECKKADIEKTIIKDDKFEIDNIQDWNLLQQIQIAENIQWIFNH